MGGYFIGTCYDGKAVFEKLKNKNKGESVSIMRDDKKMYEITKMYDETGFPDDELSIGYTINVYQESINKTFAEYLVNFNYFIRMMENYGFVLATKEQAEKMDLPNGSGLFDDLYSHMTREIERSPNKAYDYGTANQMTTDEKWISFMNRYFVFNKVRSVDSEKIYNQFLRKSGKIEENEEIDDLLKLKDEKETKEEKEEEKPIIKIRKLNKKIVLDKFSPVEEDEDVAVAPLPPLPPLPPAVPLPKIVLGETVKIMRPKK
jgi:hypothetical protein